MKAPYLALLVSCFALSAFAQDDTAFIISGTGNASPGETMPVNPPAAPPVAPASRPGTIGPNDQGPEPTQSFPPLASQGYSSSSMQDGMNYNSVGPVGPHTGPNPYPSGPYSGVGPSGVQPQPSNWNPPPGPGYDSEGVASSSSISAIVDGWTPGYPPAVTTQAPAPGQNVSQGQLGNNGYITTTLAIVIPVPLNASDYDPNIPAQIISQDGAVNVKTSVLAVSIGVVCAVAGALLF